MAFTVSRSDGGTKDAEFEAYARLLRQRHVDLGKLPRAPEPGTQRRWLYVWDSEEKAQSFADELKRRTGDDAWVVTPVDALHPKGRWAPSLFRLVEERAAWHSACIP